MAVQIIKFVNNNQIKEILKLKNPKYRKESNLFIVEGFNLVQEAIKNKVVKVILGTSQTLALLESKFNEVEEVIEVTQAICEKMSDTQTSQNVFAVCIIPTFELDEENNILLLDHIQDPGNMGTLIRSAASFGFKTVISSLNSVSYFNDKVIRSTQGNLFKVNLINEYLVKSINELKSSGYIIVGTILHSKAKALSKVKFDESKKYAILIGNEANGISPDLADLVDLNIMIEMNEEVESLNAGVAGSIIMYTVSKEQ